MKKPLLYLIALAFFILNAKAQTISIIGSTSPSANWATDIDMSTTDNITYTLNNVTLTTATDAGTTGLKFRQNHDWAINWGNSNFPSGTGVQNGPNIMTVAGTYDITFNKSNGTYTFINSSTVQHNIGIWGPAVDAINGFAGADVNMSTTDNIIYTLSGFNFTSGTAYFRENDTTTNVWGSTSFPSGTAVLGGPSIQVTGGEWFVTFNRNTGAYSFTYPSVGILGSATSVGWGEDIDMVTTNGFNYTLANLTLTDGVFKFRKDNSWDINWGATTFPQGTGTQNGPDIPAVAGTYNVDFERTSGNYAFTNTLSNSEHSISNLKIYPNPTNNFWNFSYTKTIDTIELFDMMGKTIQKFTPNAVQFQLDGSSLSQGVYFVKIKSGLDFSVQKIIRN
ncbi:MAG TPA: T9SS type A sorting domain-containing protein [Flavobacterium sp.]|uniref:T9SS type A sorting domain-containing protein n=1 Tax=Flavobacterium sp. TaxID=239 RepID=UPI002D11EAC7|nr:T9SS type A sorting domain-containing protein [Flavobacterium sp.]HNP32388.1 T9SS type A sorting domain-containing protein [Flavobacterium sp.]